jgi:hypothetical protein
MARFILDIDDSEKLRILEMHSSIKRSITEQTVSQGFSGKIGEVIKAPSEEVTLLKGGGGAVGLNDFMRKLKNGSSELYNELITEFGDKYTSFITGLSKSPNKSKNADIWYIQLTQESRKTFLTQWSSYLETASKRVQKGKKEVEIKLMEGSKTTVDVKLPPDLTEPPPPTVLLKEFKSKDAGQNVYIDNESTVTEFINSEISKMILESQKLKTFAKSVNGSVVCTKMDIVSSSSRLRNTGNASNKTWTQLSKERAENVKNVLKTGLEGLGISVPDNVITLKGGTNGDGTTGPNPPSPLKLTSDGITIITDESKRNSLGTPHTNIKDYLQYKYCIINVELQIVWGDLPTEEKQFQTITSKNYTMEINVIENIPGGRVPTSGFKSILFKPNEGTKKRLDICPAFGG